MELSHLKRSMQEIVKTVGAMVEDKLGERSQVEEQVRNMAKQVEKVVSDTLWKQRGVDKVSVRFKKLAHFKGEVPTYATPGASGFDVRACLDAPIALKPGGRVLIPTGFSLEIPKGFEVQVRPRSGLAIMKGISLVNTPGTVDSDYRGEVKVIVINHGQDEVTIADQERIAQMVVCPVVQADFEMVEELSDSDRGAGGFGSTGV